MKFIDIKADSLGLRALIRVSDIHTVFEGGGDKACSIYTDKGGAYTAFHPFQAIGDAIGFALATDNSIVIVKDE